MNIPTDRLILLESTIFANWSQVITGMVIWEHSE